MSPSETDNSVKAGADLLLKGWKMLNKACPMCYQPLYERKGKVVCVNCKKDYILVDSTSEIPINKKDYPPSASQTSIHMEQIDFTKLPPVLADSARIILQKINNLNARLNDATDPKEISELSSAISSLLNSLRSLSS